MVFIACLATPGVSTGQGVGPLDIEQAVAFGLSHHPSLRAQAALELVRRAQVDVARAGYLPNLDLSIQLNGGTGNVLRGPLFPMREIPNISGPPTGRDFGDASLGSAVGAGVAWDVIGVLERIAVVDIALAEQARATAGIQIARLTIGYGIADQFIDVLARAATVKAAQASVERARVFSTIVKTLVDQELRPGAEYSRASAELALASTQLIRAEQAEAVSRSELARALGVAGQRIEVVPGRLLELPASALSAPQTKHPLVLEADASVRASEARRHAVQLQYLPRLDLVAALWGRGSGLTSGALPPSPARGIVPDTPNWATGVVLTWPALELIAVRARQRAESAQVRVAEAQRFEVEQAIQAQIDSARAILEAAGRIAHNTPIALNAAQDAERQATARYRAGLANVVEVAEAQRLLAQAEIDDAVARLAIRRAKLLLVRAIGDLEPFLSELREGGK